MMRILEALRKASSAVVCAQFRSSDKLSSPLDNFQKNSRLGPFEKLPYLDSLRAGEGIAIMTLRLTEKRIHPRDKHAGGA